MKYTLKELVQMFLLILLIHLGICSIYAFLWCIFGLPLSWWASVLLSVLAAGTTWGFIQWIGRDDHA